MLRVDGSQADHGIKTPTLPCQKLFGQASTLNLQESMPAQVKRSEGTSEVLHKHAVA